MKTNFRVFALGMGITSLVLCVGCQGDQTRAEGPLIATAAPSFALAPAKADAKPAAPPATAPATPAIPPGSIIITKATLTNATLATNVVTGPPTLSPALAEVVRLIEANVGQDVLMAYITNSAQPFNIGANEIVYLHDLGVPPAIITTLINIDSSPEMVARKQAATAVKPLPPGVALNEPATNVFVPKGTTMTVADAPEPVPVNPPTDLGAVYTPEPIGDVAYDVAPPTTEVSYSYFYTSLAPYGTWCDVPGYGYAWRPTCATWNSSWRPYGDCGRWLWSNQGWYWYSDYSWGWAPFHYGRWCRPAGYGWCWVPDTCWGPSWVSWRYSSSYCGWAPLPPAACYTTGVGFSYYSGHVGVGFEFGLGATDYCYVPSSRFCDRRPYDYCVPAHRNHAIHKDTTVINNYVVGNNNTVVNNGVGFDRIARVTRGDINQVALKDTSSLRSLGTRHDRLESDGKTLSVYRPSPTLLARKSVVPAPRNAVNPVRPTGHVKQGSQDAASFAGKNAGSFGESARPAPTAAPAPAAAQARAAAPAPVANNHGGNGNNAGKAHTGPTPVNVYTRPLDAGRQPVIVTGGTPPPVTYTKPAPASVASQSAADFEAPTVEPQRGPKATAPGLGGSSPPGLAGKSGSSDSATHRDPVSAAKGIQQPSSGGYAKPAPGNGPTPSVASAPTGKAPAHSSAPGTSPIPKGGQGRIESSGGYQKPAVSQSPVARPGGQGVSAQPSSAPANNYSKPAPSAPAQNYSRPAPSYSAPARVESQQTRPAPSAAPAPSSGSSSSPRVSAPSSGASSGYSGGNSGGNSGGSGGGKSSGSGSAPAQGGGKGR